MLRKKYKIWAFTLIEMVIVLIIMWILLMATMALSWDHIQKIKDKSVKESIIAEWQSRYSRNLWSSSFAWTLYDKMEINLTTGSNLFNFVYFPRNGEDNEQKESPFTDNFEVKYLTTGFDDNSWNSSWLTNVTLQYEPYRIYCNILWEDENPINDVILIIRVNDSRNYCFEIQNKNCRLVEMSQSKCDNIKNIWGISD